MKRIALVLASVMALAAAPAQSETLPSARTQTFPTAHVAGSNGYSISVSGFRDHVIVDANNGTAGATYDAAGSTASVHRLRADFDHLGAVDLTFEQTGKTQRRHSEVGRCELVIVRRPGEWTGSFSFQADAGLTSATATTLSGAVRSHRFECPGPQPTRAGSGDRPESALLFARGPRSNPSFSAAHLGRPQKAFFSATATGQRGRIDSYFYASLRAAKSTFEVDGKRATVSPPPPFSGTATYDKNAAERWTGDLAVELPVVGTVALTGPEIRAQLVRAGWVGVAARLLGPLR